jgi:hypothetical protein
MEKETGGKESSKRTKQEKVGREQCGSSFVHI